MFQITFALFALVSVCLGKSIDYAPAGKAIDVGVSVGSGPALVEENFVEPSGIAIEAAPALDIAAPALDIAGPALDIAAPALDIAAPALDIAAPALDIATPEIFESGPAGPLTAETVFGGAPSVGIEQGAIAIQEPLPVEEARPGLIGDVRTELAKETIDYSAPSVSLTAPIIDLPKGAREVVDVPHANIQLAGNSLLNQNVHLNLPHPVVEAPRPIIRNKEVLFRLPQPVFYIPRPIVQHKPMVYRLGHTLRAITPIVSARSYIFHVPQAQISGKSAYTQPIPSGKSIL